MASMRSVGVRLRLYVDQYKKDVEEARRKNEELGESGKKVRADLDSVATSMGIVGAAFVAAAAAAVYASAKFDKQMSEVKAVAGATADEFQGLRDAAIEAGQATAFSASEAAAAEAELAKAGVSVADILGGGLRGSLDLAAAGTLDLATAATIAAQAMNIFDLSGADVGHVADVLAAAANKSATDVQTLGIALGQVGLVAKQVGFSMEETVGVLAAFADNALGGSDGATSLKTALLRLAAPLPEAEEAMRQYGISLYDANGQMVDAATLAGQLERGLGDLSDAERNAALATIFGQDAIRAANVLYNVGEAGIREYIAAVNDQGAAARVAEEKMNNLAGKVEELTGSLETLFIKSGEGAQGPLIKVVEWLTRVTNTFSSLPPVVQSSVVWITGATGALLLLAAAGLKARTSMVNFTTSLATVGPASAKAATAIRSVTAAAGPLGAALTALFLAYEAAPDPEDGWLGNLAALAQGVTGLALWDKLTNGGKESVGVLRDVGDAAAEVGETTGYAAVENIKLGGAFGDAANEAGGLIKAFERLNGTALNWIDAQIDAEAAVDDLRDALRDSNGSLDVTTEKGRAALSAVTDLAKAAADAAQAKYDETKSVEDANAVYEDYIAQLKETLRQAGLTQDEIDELTDSIAQMPSFKTVRINVEVKLTNGKTGIRLPDIPIFERYGGVVHAAQGRLQPTIVDSPTVIFGERGTGKEAYIPQNVDSSRALSILSEAASWHGADVVPRGGFTSGASGSTTILLQVSPAPGASRDVMNAIVDGLRFDVSASNGSSVQLAYGRRGRQ